ncbi:MAG TPA: hypothetical protein VEB21_01155 [Terriglobales bacterium]|nr:hypothetical protein [Terriglobales bacterium]
MQPWISKETNNFLKNLQMAAAAFLPHASITPPRHRAVEDVAASQDESKRHISHESGYTKPSSFFLPREYSAFPGSLLPFR